MEEIKTQAITIGYTNYREYDRVLTLFSPEYGLLTATAHAVRRGKSEIRACADLFFYGEFVLKKNAKGYLSVKSIDMTDIFYDLRMDINRLSCATYLCDFVKETALKEYEQSEYFILLLKALMALCYDKADFRVVKTKFEISAMEALGYGAEFEKCAECGKEFDKRAWFVDGSGGAECSVCNLNHYGVEVSLRGLATLKQIKNMPIDSLNIIKMSDEVYEELRVCLKRYMYWHIEKSFKSASFLEKNYNYIK
jgi:DNA repair protein RecO (recombination protein O)